MRLAHGGEGRFVFAVPDSRFPNPYPRFPIITLVAYDSTWPLEFAAEAERIERACAGLPIRLEHIGSTAVPGLAAQSSIPTRASSS